MTQVFAKHILLDDGWAHDVSMTIDCNGVIQEIKPQSQLDSQFQGHYIAGSVIPGMVNNHSHAFQWAMAGLAEQSGEGKDSFWSWRKVMYDFVGKIMPEDLKNIATALYMQMLKAGYTSVGEFHYLHHDIGGVHYNDIGEMSWQIAQAANDSGINVTLLPVFYRYAGFGEQAPNHGQNRFINDQDFYAKLLARVADISQETEHNFGIAPHSLRAVNKDDMEFAIAQLDSFNYKSPIHIHIAEQLKEVDDCLDFYGQRPVEWLHNNFEINERWCLVHATHINDKEIQQTADSKAIISVCTTTEGNLGDGYFEMLKYQAANGRWGIGSDSHISVCATEELRWLEYQNRLKSHSRTVLTEADSSSNGYWLWANAAQGGAQSLNVQAGQIAKGYRADFIELDNNALALFAKQGNQLLDGLIFNHQNDSCIQSVWSKGKKVIESNYHAKETIIIDNYKKTLKKLLD